MPRDLPLGNGDLLVTFDSRYQLRDIYFPQVGLENHTGGEPCRFGVWVDGRFAWTGDDGWERDLRYAHETLVSEVTLGHAALGLRIRCRDTVDFDRNLYLKEVTVEDVTGTDRDVRVFQHFDAHLWGNDIGDSAFYDPRTRAVVHYKGRRYFLLTGVNAKGESGLTSFAIGLKEALGREGTWRDAEDGELSRNLVAQGSIDSVGMLGLRVPANALATATFVIAAGQTYDEVRDLDKLVRERGVGSFLSRTGDYWNLWANKDETIADHLPDPLIHLYKQSTLVIRTQVDNRGAIIAGNDSDVLRFNRDTYSYLWPRDGALVANALDLAGYGEVTRRFFYLCGELMTRDGYLLHKYNPDGSVGSSWHAWSTPDGRLELPIQEDETGLPLWALWQHYDRDRDIEFVRPLYRKLVRTGADFMSSYREPRTKLPAPSFDLWEERRGIHAFTTAAVWAGLSAARDFAGAFGQHDLSKRYGTAAEEIKTAALTHLYDDERGRFVRTVTVLPDGTIAKDATLDMSMAGIFLFGMLPADDPRVVATMRALEARLWVKTAIGGFARYENDSYFQQSSDIANVPGNPWFVATLWVAEHHIAAAKSMADLDRPRELLEWCATKASRSGVLAEQVHPLTGDPMSVAPLTWSHAAYVGAVQRYARKSRLLKDQLRARVKSAGEVIA
ncbi:MAG TPA: glycoside hydrolase family 15 protein [Chloroflexi bacterium]|jgi:GH15 family glucan-1,4-alpha-glucosidase|nr:glycoside hydrolase family 15 protein [Chloroflexota bacterium]